VLDGPVLEMGAARERHITIPSGAYGTPFWVVFQPSGDTHRVDSLPWRYQGVVESVRALSAQPAEPPPVYDPPGRDLPVRWHVEAEAAGEIEFMTHRLLDGSGLTQVSSGIPLVEGQVTPATIGGVSVVVDGVEQSAYVEGMGRFQDQSYRSLLVQFPYSLASGHPVAGSVVFGTTPTQPRRAKVPVTQLDMTVEDVNGRATARRLPLRGMSDPKRLGWPDGVAMPSAAWLRHTKVFWDVVPEAEVTSYFAGVQYPDPANGTMMSTATQAQKFNDMWWTWMFEFDYTTSSGAFGAQTVENYANPNRYSGTQPSDWLGIEPPEFYDWRGNFYEPVSFPSFNYYDMVMLCFQRFAMTGDVRVFQMACAYGWTYAYTTWIGRPRAVTGGTRLNGHDMVQEKQYLPEGMGMAYLMTGDPMFLDMLQETSGIKNSGQPDERFTSAGGFAYRFRSASTLAMANEYQGEGRPIARILSGRHWAWRCTRPAAETASPSRETFNWAAAIEDGVNRCLAINRKGNSTRYHARLKSGQVTWASNQATITWDTERAERVTTTPDGLAIVDTWAYPQAAGVRVEWELGGEAQPAEFTNMSHHQGSALAANLSVAGTAGRLWVRVTPTTDFTGGATGGTLGTARVVGVLHGGADAALLEVERVYHNRTIIAGDTSRQPEGYWAYWRDGGCNLNWYSSYNAFMMPMVMDALMKAHDDYNYRRAEIVQAVKDCADWMWSVDWKPQVYDSDRQLYYDWFSFTTYGLGSGWNKCTRREGGSANLTNMYPTNYAWLAKQLQDATYSERARQVFHYAVGTGALDGKRAPYMAAANATSMKIRREFYCYSQVLFAMLRDAP
jgi:hypothetical protein